MTVADNTSRNQYTATSGQTVFAYTFEIVDKDHIVVLQNGTALSEGTDYTVSNVGNDNGGNITLTSGATAGDVMTLYRDMPYSRTQNYTNSGDFLASEVNADFDELWLAGEQTDRSFSQSIRKPITDSDSISMELPEAATRANKFVKFDATGAVDVAGATITVDAEDVSITDAGNYYTSNNVEGALQEVGADLAELDSGNYLSVTDFGAKGDGTTDDTTAIQNAINAASKSNTPTGQVQTIFFPDGHYKFTTLRFYYDLADNPGFESTENRDGRFQIRGTGRLSINDLKNYDGTNTARLYGAVLESTGDGIILTESTTKQAQNFVAKDLTIIANNSGHILKTSYSPGLTFDHCSFKQLNSAGNGLQCQNTWWFMMNQCYVFGATSSGSPAANTGYGIEFGVSTLAGEFTIIGSLIDAWKDGLLYNSNSLSVNFSIRDSGFQNINRYGIYAYKGTLVQLLLDNVYFENQANQTDVGQGVSYIKDNNENDPPGNEVLGRIRNLRMNSCFFLGGHGPANLSTITGPMIDLDLIDALQIEGCFVFRPFKTFLNVTDTINPQNISGEIKNCYFQQDRDVTAEPTIFLLSGILPNVHNCVWPGYDDGVFDTTNDIQLFDSTVNGQYLREYTNIVTGDTGIAKLSFGDTNVETVTSSPYIINDVGNEESKTYFDLTHNLDGGLQVRLPDRTEKGDGRLIVIKNNEATTSTLAFPYINVVNNSNQSTNIARLSPGQAGLFVFDGQKPKVKINATALQEDFVFDFKTNLSSELRVTKNGVEIDEGITANDYSVTLNADQTTNPGGTVTLVTPANAGDVIKIGIKGLFKYVGRTFQDNVILQDDQKISLGRGSRITETFTPQTPETQFTYTFDSPDIAAQIMVERKLSGGVFVRTFDFTVNLSTKLVTLDTVTASGEEVKISKYVGDMEIYHDSTSNESRIDTLAGLTLDGLTYPTADGTSGQSIITDGAGNLTFGTAAGTGITAVVEDTTPQLGGDLESNGNDILFADNDKAIFGAGSDLQIYHSGAQSVIADSGTGQLTISTNGTDVRLSDNSGNRMLIAKPGAEVELYHNASAKLATTSTGIDVTGSINTVLSVDGTTEDVFITGATPGLEFVESDNGGSRMRMAYNNATMFQSLYGDTTTTFGSFNLQTRASDGTSNQLVYAYDGGANDRHTWGTRAAGDVRMQLKSNGDFEVRGGDVIFENSARTSDDFYWDASTSRLGLGNIAPTEDLHIGDGTASVALTLQGTDAGINAINMGDATNRFAGRILYNNSSNDFAFHCAGSERVRFASSGNVGIGTTSPAYQLDVQGSSAAVRLDNTAGSPDQTLALFQADLGVNDRNFQIKSPTTDSASAPFRFTTGNSFAFEIDSTTDALVIDANANVGIGTDTPSNDLHVNSSGNTVAKISSTFSGSTTTGLYIDTVGDTSAARLLFSKSGVTRGIIGYSHDATATSEAITFSTAGGSEKMRIEGSGNVGIGESAPDEALVVRGGNYASNQDGGIAIQSGDASGSHLKAAFKLKSDGSGVFRTVIESTDGIAGNTIEAISIANNTGFVGIGTGATLPARELEIASIAPEIRLSDTDGTNSYCELAMNAGICTITSRNDTQDAAIRFRGAGGGVSNVYGLFDANGRFIVGRESASVSNAGVRVENLGGNNGLIYISKTGSGEKTAIGNYHNGTYVGGVNYSDTATSFPTSSDQRLKENIVDAPSASDDIDAIQVRSFDWKADGSHQKYGMVAQELQSVAPEAVTEGDTETDMMGVDYSKLVPMLVKEIQSLRARVAQLEGTE